MGAYYYKIHSYVVESYFLPYFIEKTLPPLLSSSNIKVVKSDDLKVPNYFDKPLYIKANLEKVSIYYSDIAYIEITNHGSEIRVKELFSERNKTIFFSKFLNHIIPMALYQKEKLMIHASGVSSNGEGILFVGQSGSGKSSLAASLKDFNIISEDSVCIEFNSEGCYTYTSFPFIKLTDTVATRLQFNKSKKIALPGDRLSRSYYRIANISPDKIRLKKCYILSWGEEFSITRPKIKNFIGAFLSSSYGAMPIGSCAKSATIHHRFVSRLFSSLPTYILTRNKSNFFNDNAAIIDHINIASHSYSKK